MARALVALGSNLGDRHALIEAAIASLGRLPGTRLVARSRRHETPPERPGDGGLFVNAAALLESSLGPRRLLVRMLALEASLGRTRDPDARGPRTIDLDLILFEGHAARGPDLTLPHPRYRGRRFVLAPAAEVAPDLRDPITGRTIREHLASLSGSGPSSVRASRV